MTLRTPDKAEATGPSPQQRRGEGPSPQGAGAVASHRSPELQDHGWPVHQAVSASFTQTQDTVDLYSSKPPNLICSPPATLRVGMGELARTGQSQPLGQGTSHKQLVAFLAASCGLLPVDRLYHHLKGPLLTFGAASTWQLSSCLERMSRC